MSKGYRLLKNGFDNLDEILREISKNLNARKEEEIFSLFHFLLQNTGKSLSGRKLSLDYDSKLTPVTIGKYLDQYVEHFPLYRLEGFDLSTMKETRGNFRLYPYDTSMYSFSSRQVAEHLDLLSMTPVIGKLKEDSFECHSAYIHKQKPINGKRTYIEEDVGILAVKNNKRFLIALNMSGSNDKTKLLKICPEWWISAL